MPPPADPSPVKTHNENIIVADAPATIPPASVGLKKTDFPVYLAGVPSLLHPIVPSVPLQKKPSYNKEHVDNNDVSYFQQVNPYQFNSNVYNIVFENIKSGLVQRLFPEDNYIIKAVFYPTSGVNNTENLLKNQTDISPNQHKTKTNINSLNNTKVPDKILFKHFLYEIKEQPTDDNSKTNIDDQLALYMSDEDGKNLVKLHPNNQYLKSSYWLPELGRFYFTTQADSNGDNIIDDNDKYYNYMIDFTKEKPTLVSYNYLK